MKAAYDDILNASRKQPLWYDRNGVPRFEKFEPRMCPNIYERQVFLTLISCQHCGKRFDVEVPYSDAQYLDGEVEYNDLEFHYGDPPRHYCVGDTMNCNDLYILEAWIYNHKSGQFERRRELERLLEDADLLSDEERERHQKERQVIEGNGG